MISLCAAEAVFHVFADARSPPRFHISPRFRGKRFKTQTSSESLASFDAACGSCVSVGVNGRVTDV